MLFIQFCINYACQNRKYYSPIKCGKKTINSRLSMCQPGVAFFILRLYSASDCIVESTKFTSSVLLLEVR